MEEAIFEFNIEKNIRLKERYDIEFHEIITLINDGKAIDVIGHPNQREYPGQEIYIIDVDGYVYMVPFVRNGEKRFLKTFYPSRKATKKYLKEKQYEAK